MNQLIRISIAVVVLSTQFAYAADEDPNVNQGTQKYDWQTCVNTKTDSCVTACDNSEDINCNNNCAELAKDKCQSEGVNPP